MNVHITAILQQAGAVREEFLEELFSKLNLKDEYELIKQKGR